MNPPDYHVPAPPTGTEARVCEFIASRQRLGLAKYGVSVENNPLSLLDWLKHQQAELADALVYCTRAIEEISHQSAAPQSGTIAPESASCPGNDSLRTG